MNYCNTCQFSLVGDEKEQHGCCATALKDSNYRTTYPSVFKSLGVGGRQARELMAQLIETNADLTFLQDKRLHQVSTDKSKSRRRRKRLSVTEKSRAGRV